MSESTEKAPENEQVCNSNAETADKNKPTVVTCETPTSSADNNKPTVVTCETPTSSESTKETQDAGPQKVMSGSLSIDVPGIAPEVRGNEASIKNEKSSTVTTNNDNAERGTESKPPEVKEEPLNSLHQLSDLASQKLQNSKPSVVPSSDGDEGGTDNASEAETQKVKTEKRSTKPKKDKAHLRKGKWTVCCSKYIFRFIVFCLNSKKLLLLFLSRKKRNTP